MNQLSTLHNLKLWNCSPTNLCPKCGIDQTNKHVLSNCSSPDALAQCIPTGITISLNEWLNGLCRSWSVASPSTVISECLEPVRSATYLTVSDLIWLLCPTKKIVVGELTVCHETNFQHSRDYKLQKYANLEAARSSEFSSHAVLVHTIEVSTLGFVVAEPNFFKTGEYHFLILPLWKNYQERQ